MSSLAKPLCLTCVSALDEAHEAVWAFVDSGSSVHVVDVGQVMPGAKENKPKPASRGFTAACGGTAPDLGSCDVPAVPGDNKKFDLHWRNATVAMPIISARLLAVNKCEFRYQAEGGQVVNARHHTNSAFISSSGCTS